MANIDLTKIDLYEYTLSNADMSNIDQNAQYAIKDMPIGGITNAEMVLALQSTKQGIFRVGSVYMCTDTVLNQYTEKHFYKFTGLAWEDVTGDITVIDSALDANSTNPVQNKVVTNALSGKQAEITSSNKLSADLVDDTSTTNKFVTSAEKSQIATNTGNISSLNTNKANKTSSATYTLTAANWSSNQYTLSVTGKTASNNADVSPWQGTSTSDSASVKSNADALADANIYQIIDNGTSLTFVCETTPTTDIKVNVEVYE